MLVRQMESGLGDSMYKSTFLYIQSLEKGKSVPHRAGQNSAISSIFRPGYYPGKNGQKIGMMATLAMKVIMQSGTPTLT